VGTNVNTLKIYLKEIRHHIPSFSLAFIFLPLNGLMFDTFLVYFLSHSIGSLASGNEHDIYQNLLFASFAGLAGVICNLIGYQFLIRHEAKVRSRIYSVVFEKILNKDLQFFVNEKVGALTSHFIDFTRAHITIQDLIVIRTLGFLLSVITGMVILGINAPILALVLTVLLVLVIIETQIFTKIRTPLRRERKTLVGKIHGEAADAITNSLIVKTFAQEKFEVKNLSKRLDKFQTVFIKDISLFGIDGTVRLMLMVITQIAGIALSAWLVLNGQLELSLAIFALAYLQRIASQIFQLGELINGYDEALLQAAPMSDILTKPIEVYDSPNAKNHAIQHPSIELQGASYSYSGNNAKVLDNINLSIPAGQKLGLVGHSGAGKTTLTHLLLRFADVSDGAMLIDGLDIRDYTQESLRKQIAYVPQEPMLFHRSLRENIKYGKPDASDEEIIHAAKQANAMEFISKLPQGLDTLVGERGVKLSGGQKQRIAIARAVLKDAPILVLDEATSALDSESEKLIQAALKKLMQGRTSVVIAHRLSTIATLDRIIVLSDGRVAEDGNHRDLLQNPGGIYAKLWAHQSGGFIEE